MILINNKEECMTNWSQQGKRQFPIDVYSKELWNKLQTNKINCTLYFNDLNHVNSSCNGIS